MGNVELIRFFCQVEKDAKGWGCSGWWYGIPTGLKNMS